MCLIAFAGLAAAYETDPYTGRHIDIADSGAVLDAQVNAALDDVAAAWRGGANERRFVTAIYRQVGGRHWVDKLERWAIDAPEVEKLPVTRRQSIYGEAPLYATRVAGLFGFGPIIKVHGARLGTDKIGHFFSQGRKFYLRWRRSGDVAKAARRSVTTEKALFGRFFTGAYSNADIVANYEGFLFYRSLFNDGVVGDKPSIMAWREGKPARRRDFSWADHVNAFWDEALNPNAYDALLLPHVKRFLRKQCDQFLAQPERYTAPGLDDLYERYRPIGVLDTRDLRPAVFLARECAQAPLPDLPRREAAKDAAAAGDEQAAPAMHRNDASEPELGEARPQARPRSSKT